ncbi:MAG: SGNH/GDSL hydrolase family protein [Lactobacillales bacterium]|jgi:lysophospholipase L1-like esterase|nr:SGNH/GDSL hydrolase family protein [Lactobacillales bacterium]
MSRKKKYVIEFGTFFMTLFLVIILLNIFLTPQKAQFGKLSLQSKKEPDIYYVAIGDSLTEGVGDTTGSGGFIPIVKQEVEEKYDVNVKTENFGVSGNTSTQILSRLDKKDKIKEGMKKADFITITVGGNDVMKVIREDFFKLSQKSFDKPMVEYQARIQKLLFEIRELNDKAPIYVVGIYNPFYLNFPEITTMQDVINNWNDATQKVVEAEGNSYFIPINDLLYKGIDGEKGIAELNKTTSSSSSTSKNQKPETITNDALYEGDSFHPNNLGYEIMANAVVKELGQTKNRWINH